MEYRDKTLCLTSEDLSTVMEMSTLWKNVQRGNILCVNRGGGEGNQALYAWSSIPAKYQKKFIEKCGDPEVIMKKAMLLESVKPDPSARSYYESYTYEGATGKEVHLSAKLIDEYTLNASVIRALMTLHHERKQKRASLGKGMTGTWETIYENSEKLREVCGHTLPTSIMRLKSRMKAFEKEGYAALISGKIGNKNTVKLTAEFARLLVALKRSHTPVYTDAQLFARANELARENGWKPLRSLSGMKAWLNSPEVQPLWWDAVHGEQSARQRFNRKHKTMLPTRRDSLWYGDGTKLNLYYRDEQDNIATMMVYEVVDAMSEVLLGYHISDSEDYEAQYHAYRMAIQTAGHKPYEIVHDNQGGHKKLERNSFWDHICHVRRTTMPYNGESKTIESIFGRFQQQVLHKDWRFTGQNITAKKASSRANVEFIKANADELYTLDELKNAYAQARKEWNEGICTATGKRRIDMYLESVNEDTPEVTIYDMIDMFWVFTDKAVTFTDRGITITVKGKKYTYEVYASPGVPDHDWRRVHTYEKFIVAYDPYDMTSVRLYSIDKAGGRRFERVAEPYMVIHRAIQDQHETDDAKFIRMEQEANLRDRIERHVAGRKAAQAYGTDPEQNGLTTPGLKGISAEAQREIERRTARYALPVDEYELGRVTKRQSMIDWMEPEEEDDKKSDSTLQRAVGKL